MTTATDPRPRVLCVDDDAFMLNILTKTIGVDYEVLTSSGSAAALQLIENSESIQVVISDHRMPDLSGAQFLRAVRDKHPLIVRILLTGETDLVEAVAAMNQAGLFRFLVKPGTRAVLLDTLQAASGHCSRSFASVATQLGHIALPERTLGRLYAGETLSPAESAQVAQSALVGESVLKRIPRLDPVVEILSRLAAGRITDASRRPDSMGAEILHVVTAYEALERTTTSRDTAVNRMRAQTERFDPEALTALIDLLDLEGGEDETIEVTIGRVCIGNFNPDLLPIAIRMRKRSGAKPLKL